MKRTLILYFSLLVLFPQKGASQSEMTAEKAREMRLAEDKKRQQKMMNELLSSSAADLKLATNSYYTDFQKGLEYHLKGDHANAKPYYEKCLAVNPLYVEALYNLADIYSVRGDTQKALELIKQAIENGFTDINGLYADDEMAKLIATTAFQTYIKSVWLPSHQRAEELAVVAMSAYQNAENQKAITKWQEAIAAERSGTVVRPIIIAVLNENIGSAYLNLGYNQKAYDHLIKAYNAYTQLNKELNVATTANNVGYALFGLLKTKEAVPYLEEALEIHRRLGMFNEFANDIMSIGAISYQNKDYQKAFVYCNKALEYAKMTGDENTIQTFSANLASAMLEVGLFEEGIPILEKSIIYFQKNDKYLDAAIYKGNLGIAHKERGDYQKAKSYFEEAVKFHKKAGNKEETAKLLTYLSDTYEVAGDYKLALKYAQESHELYKDLDNAQYMVFGLQTVASIYQSMGQFPEAIKNYNKALEICTSKGLKESEETTHLGLGGVYRKMEDFGNSLISLKKATAIAQNVNDEDGLATIYTNLGLLYSDQNQDTEALSYFKKALELNQKLGDEHGISVAMANIASINYKTGNLMEAVESYKKSLAYFEERGELSQQLRLLSNIGAMYYNNQQANLAIPYFEKSVKIGERLRLEAEGNAKRDYLATIIDDYRWLMYCHAYKKDAANVFKVSEAVHGRVLGEQLGANVVSDAPSILQVQSELEPQTALLVYTDPTRDIVQLAITNQSKMVGMEKSEPFEASMKSIIQKVNDSNLIPKRGFKIVKNQSPVTVKESQTETVSPQFKEDFEKIIMYYRSLLKSPDENPDREYIAKKLYNYLLSGVSSSIQGKTELIIIADGILGYLPFETLISPDGKYLTEKYEIKYIPSYAIYQKLKERNYASTRKDLLAFGGAKYELTAGESRGFAQSIASSEELKQLTFELLDDERGFKKTGSVSQAYPKLGVGSWADLPGTLTEVQNIHSIYPSADIKTKEMVSESNVKSMALSNYKIVHFATHGIVVPEIPELSAIVLNQIGNTSEDGYLTMVEIQKLKFNADFVNLSACETGLGRIYGGEGVVGLTSAFLLSGANGVSASLWQVADESTMEFMTGVYQLMKGGETPVSASADMKRKFISGSIKPEYRHPFYWAPFVYYGK